MGSSTIGRFDLHTKLLVITVLLAVLPAISALTKQTSRTTPTYLKKHDADCETHTVKTADKYILTLHRVLCGQNNTQGVALLQHGLMESSSDWILLGNNSLGLYLCEKGYDVWLGNSRGNRYSKKHATMSTLNPHFWTFSWHEMGVYDLPAVINYILKTTGENKLHYVGHSQGTTEFMVYSSTYPDEAANKVQSAHLLAPVGYMYHMKTPLAAVAAPLFGLPDPLSYAGDIEFIPNTFLSGIVGQTVCHDHSPTVPVCDNAYFLICGYSENMETSVLRELLYTKPGGASLRQIKHYLQEKGKKNCFRPYDFGVAINLIVYGHAKPKSYNLGKIKVPIYAHYGALDLLADPVDVELTLKQMNPKIVKRKALYTDYNHLDLMFAYNVRERVYDTLEDDMCKSRTV